MIDYFLGLNPSLQDLGRMLIAWSILECEAGPSGDEDWLRFVRHQLTVGCEEPKDLLDNRVTFITFNYDVSLERSLRSGLSAYEYFEEAHIDAFFDEERIIHVYGRVRHPTGRMPDLLPIRSAKGAIDQAKINALDRVFELSRGIKVIDPYDKDEDEASIRLARGKIRRSEIAYILGFGFDPNNIGRLQLESLREGNDRLVMFTNMDDHGRINRRADRLFFGAESMFTRGEMNVISGPLKVNRSIRNVYAAMQRDFDALEDLLTLKDLLK